MSHRISKKQLKRDEFTEDLMKTVNFIKRYPTETLAVIVGIIVIAVGVVFISQNRAKNELQAGLMLNSAHGALFSGAQQQALEAYKEIASRFGSTQAGQEARIYLGNINLQQRNYDEALKNYQDCLRSRPKNPLLLYAALSGLAACWEQQGDFSKAAEQYAAIARRLPREEYLASAALLDAGRCYQRAGQPDQARRVYQKILDDYPGGPLYLEAKTSLQMVPRQS